MGEYSLMTQVNFSTSERFEIAQELLRNAPPTFGIRCIPTEPSIHTSDERIGKLLRQVEQGGWAILPYFQTKGDYWLLTGIDLVQLEQARKRMDRFLTPSYGYYDPEQTFPQIFDAEQSKFQAHAAPIFLGGYFRWRSLPRDRDKILDRIALWLSLEASEPGISQSVVYSYTQLHEVFQESLATKSWEQANWALAELSRHHLTSADNLLFLKLQLLDSQELWQRIWEDPSYPSWASMTIPRSVRSVLLRTCYRVILEEFENNSNWSGGLEAFTRARLRLGKLLSGPFQLDYPDVARMVIYQAIADSDLKRISYLRETGLDPLSSLMLDGLLAIYPLAEVDTQERSVLERAREALGVQDFALAEQLIPNVSEPDTRALLFIELAFHTHDEPVVQRAWGYYQSLSFAQQEDLPSHPRFVEEYLVCLKDWMLPARDTGSGEKEPDVTELENRPDQSLKTWILIGRLERALRGVIEKRYQQHFGPEWEGEIHPDQEALKKWREMRTRDIRTFGQHDLPEVSLLEYTYLEDLSGMLLRQWTLFGDFFKPQRIRKQDLADKIRAVSRVRNPLAHNRSVPQNELARAGIYCDELLHLFSPS